MTGQGLIDGGGTRDGAESGGGGMVWRGNHPLGGDLEGEGEGCFDKLEGRRGKKHGFVLVTRVGKGKKSRLKSGERKTLESCKGEDWETYVGSRIPGLIRKTVKD